MTPTSSAARVFAVLAALSALAAPLHAQRKVHTAYAATPDVSVRLFASVGIVQVVGWEKDSVVVSGVVASGSQVSLGTPGIGPTRGLKLFVESPTEQAGREGSLTMHVPRGARVWLKTGSADVTVSDVTGGLDVNVVGGSITVHGSPRELRAESMDGAVAIDGTPPWMRVKTATGNITLRGGEDIGASTISGTIDARGGQTERAKLESTTGDIRFALGLARGASVEMETHSGLIDMQLSRKTYPAIEAATVTGAIENAWSKTPPVAGREARGMTLSYPGDQISGRIELRSFKGKIALRAM
ncbi:MAG: DUF4097 family beta strand repeat-containing protein [Gemmatimonadaceae bacterium]